MKTNVACFTFALLCFQLLSCQRVAEPIRNVELNPAGFDGIRALKEVASFVAIGPRVSGTPGASKAAKHIEQRLREIGLSPAIDTFTEDTPHARTTFQNITASIKGTGSKLIVLLSHYDTKSGMTDDFIGANDSGSSTGLLIEFARLLHASPPCPVTFLIAFVDGEECIRRYSGNDGLHGSKRLSSVLVKDGMADAVLAVIVVDMIGDKDLSVTIPRNGTPSLISAVLNAAHHESVRDKFSLTGIIIDDHVPFLKAGMPAVNLIDFKFGSKPGKNDYWHTSQDTMDKLSAESLTTVGRVVVRTINSIMRNEEQQ